MKIIIIYEKLFILRNLQFFSKDITLTVEEGDVDTGGSQKIDRLPKMAKLFILSYYIDYIKESSDLFKRYFLNC